MAAGARRHLAVRLLLGGEVARARVELRARAAQRGVALRKALARHLDGRVAPAQAPLPRRRPRSLKDCMGSSAWQAPLADTVKASA